MIFSTRIKRYFEHPDVLLRTFEHSDAHFVAIGQPLQRAHHYGIHDVGSFLTRNLKEISQSQHFSPSLISSNLKRN